MMNRFSAIIVLFFALTTLLIAGRAEERALLDLVPANSEIILSADAAEWFKVPALKKKVAENHDLKEFSRRLDIRIEDLSAVVFWMKGADCTLLTAWKTPFIPEKVFKAPYFVCTRKKIQGMELYALKRVKFSPKVSQGKKVRQKKAPLLRIALLPRNVVCFFFSRSEADLDNGAVRSLKLMEGKRGYQFPLTLSGALRGVYRNDKNTSLIQAALSCSMAGKKNEDLSLFLSGTFNTAEEAANMRSQVMFMSSFILMQFFKEKPELGAELLKYLKFDLADRTLMMKTMIPGRLLELLGEEAAAAAKERKAARKKRRSAVPAAKGGRTQ